MARLSGARCSGAAWGILFSLVMVGAAGSTAIVGGGPGLNKWR